MGTTTPRGLPVPATTDPDAVPADLLALAQALDPSLTDGSIRMMLLKDGASAPSGSAVRGVFWLNTTTGDFYGPVGGTWTLLNPASPTGGITPSSSAPGDAASQGTSTTAAAADHKHAREGFGTPGSSAPGDGASAGVSGSLARADHQHGREAFGAVGDIAALSPTSSASAGILPKVARADHQHALTNVKVPVGLGMPGVCTIRASTISYVVPAALSVTGFQAVLGAGSGTVVQLTKNGTTVGSASSALSTTVGSTSFSAVTFARGDKLGLTITTAGTSASDVSAAVDAVFS